MDNDLTTLRKMILYLKFSTQPNHEINVRSTVRHCQMSPQTFFLSSLTKEADETFFSKMKVYTEKNDPGNRGCHTGGCEGVLGETGKGMAELQGGRPGTQLSEGRVHRTTLSWYVPGVGQWIRRFTLPSQSEFKLTGSKKTKQAKKKKKQHS